MIKPPYGLLAAVSLDRGELMWQTPHGDTPDNVRNHAALKGVGHPQDGPGRDIGRGTPGHEDSGRDGRSSTDGDAASIRVGAMLRAYDKTDGKGSRRRVDGRAAERFADDVLRRRPSVHRRRDWRRPVSGRVLAFSLPAS